MPNVINHFKVKQLEAQFKRADNIITQAFQRSILELGYMNVSELTFKGSDYTPEKFEQFKLEVAQLNEIWLKQFPKIKKVNRLELYHKQVTSYDFFGKAINSGHDNFFVEYNSTSYILPNGMLISPLAASYNGPNSPALIRYVIDTNNPFKGPNRWGYDLFQVHSDLLEKII